MTEVAEKQTFVIPGRLAGANDLIDAINQNRLFGNKLKKENTKICAEYAIASNLKHISTPIRIEIRWIERDMRRDLDNIAFGIKFILDGLVQANKIPNDTRAWVTAIHHDFPNPQRFDARIEVDLIPV